MTDENTDDREPTESNGAATDDRSGGFRLRGELSLLSDLLGSLVEVNVEGAPPPRDDPPDRPMGDAVREPADDDQDRDRSRRVRTAEDDDTLIDTRFEGETFVVIADVPGASKDDLSLGIDPDANELVLQREGSVAARIDLPWRSVEPTRVWFRNGILEVRLRPSEA